MSSTIHFQGISKVTVNNYSGFVTLDLEDNDKGRVCVFASHKNYSWEDDQMDALDLAAALSQAADLIRQTFPPVEPEPQDEPEDYWMHADAFAE